jgi:hypothetical protein
MQLGDNTTTGRLTPVKVLPGSHYGSTYSQFGADPNNPIVAIAAGGVGGTSNMGHSVAIAASGIVYSWGDNRKGELGLGTQGAQADQGTPQPVNEGVYDGTTYLGDRGNIVSVVAHQTHTTASTGNCYEVFAWGEGSDGRLGNNTTVIATEPDTVQFNDALFPYRRVITRGPRVDDWDPTGHEYVMMPEPLTETEPRLLKNEGASTVGRVHTLLTGVTVDAVSARLQVGIDALRPAEGVVEVFSLTGDRIEVSPATVSLERGVQRITVQLPETLGDGMYLLRVSAGGDTGMQRFVFSR